MHGWAGAGRAALIVKTDRKLAKTTILASEALLACSVPDVFSHILSIMLKYNYVEMTMRTIGSI